RLSGRGNERAFGILYQRHRGSVFRFALHMSGRKELAEEVTQEVFLALIREPRQYRPQRGSLQGFLIGIARNKMRRHLGRRASGLDQVETRVSVPDPFDSYSKKDEARALHAAILTLPPRYREIIVLCDLEEMDCAEAGRLLGCVAGTVKSRLHRARNLLGAKLRIREKCSV
ncbi:MAG: RNA polymerase sigma factor, partial [Bryobacteraceae bacterium]